MEYQVEGFRGYKGWTFILFLEIDFKFLTVFNIFCEFIKRFYKIFSNSYLMLKIYANLW